MPLKTLLNSEISHRSKFEATADKKSKGAQVTKFVPDLVQKIVGKISFFHKVFKVFVTVTSSWDCVIKG